MSDIDEIMANAHRLKEMEAKEKPEVAAEVEKELKNIEMSVKTLEELLRANGFVWVTDEDLITPQTHDDVPDAQEEEFPFDFPATCPYCKARWRFSERASEHFSIRLNMCVVAETVIICPACRKKSMIAPKGKVSSKEVGDGAGISFKREGAVLRKVDP
jgi:hypothetical protein